ncbi:LPXTG cell wall anchor domain-containing protein [Amycolatopsis samaneae]|uniref:LPXTG cell wall anchor domain-containing protein n=1 Tax=Amycolatopsis samaneae TaxID=664691 RepID=A0ABW5GNC8_9PSEU
MPVVSRRSVRAGVGVVALTTVALLGTATSAFACHTDDGRAKPIPGSVTKCDQVGKKGQLSHEDVTFTGGDGEKYLNITAVGEGVKITEIVVEGGKDGYNVYQPGKLADLPWKELRAPKTVDNKDAKIDHWFLCGSKTEKPTKPAEPTKPTQAPTSSAAPTSAAPSTSDSAAPSSSAVPAPAVDAGGANGGGLANTGFDNGWLIWVGALLLLGGAAVLTLLKLRRRTQ